MRVTVSIFISSLGSDQNRYSDHFDGRNLKLSGKSFYVSAKKPLNFHTLIAKIRYNSHIRVWDSSFTWSTSSQFWSLSLHIESYFFCLMSHDDDYYPTIPFDFHVKKTAFKDLLQVFHVDDCDVINPFLHPFRVFT